MTWGQVCVLLLVLLVGYTVGGSVILWQVRGEFGRDDE